MDSRRITSCKKAIRCGWVNEATKNEHGVVHRLKSRLVANSQKPEIDDNDASASVGDKVILRLVLILVLHLGYELFQFGSTQLTCIWYLKEIVCTIQPECFHDVRIRPIVSSSSKVYL